MCITGAGNCVLHVRNSVVAILRDQRADSSMPELFPKHREQRLQPRHVVRIRQFDS